MGHSPGPAWARALSGQDPDPSDLPPPTQEFLAHVMKLATTPPATSDERQAADLETWRILNGPVLPFDEAAARHFVERSYHRARDPAAALHHDQACRADHPDRQAPLATVTAPALVIQGTADLLRPPRLTARPWPPSCQTPASIPSPAWATPSSPQRSQRRSRS